MCVAPCEMASRTVKGRAVRPYATIPRLLTRSMQHSDETRADIALLARIVARDERALAELYDQHGRLLFGLILRIVRERGDAEEILQEVFVQAWTRADTYTAVLGTPAGWLIGIARH